MIITAIFYAKLSLNVNVCVCLPAMDWCSIQGIILSTRFTKQVNEHTLFVCLFVFNTELFCFIELLQLTMVSLSQTMFWM